MTLPELAEMQRNRLFERCDTECIAQPANDFCRGYPGEQTEFAPNSGDITTSLACVLVHRRSLT